MPAMLLTVSNGTRAVLATSAVFLPNGATFNEPLAAGTIVGSIIVSPPTWSGSISIVAPFEMSGIFVVVGDVPLAAGTHSVSGSVIP